LYLAPQIGLIDKPNALRKIHKNSVPVGGGIVIFLTTTLVFLAVCLLLNNFNKLLLTNIIVPLLGGSAFLVAVGLADDKWELSGKIKLFSQIAVATVLIVFARNFSTISVFGFQYDLGHLFYPLGILWFVGLINAVNFLDGADGVCSTAGIFMSLGAAILAFITGQTAIALLAIIFAGSLAGFLFWNFPPAKVYLGDTGSMLIGFVTGTLLLKACTVDNRTIHIIPPLVVATIPFFDLVLSFFRRISSGRGLFSPDRGHIHHRLLVKFGSVRKILLHFAVYFTLCVLAACISMKQNDDWISLLVFVTLPCGMILTRLFGWEESNILVGRMIQPFVKRFNKTHYEKTGELFCYQGNGPWKHLWLELLSVLKRYHCVKANMNINIPSHHESYIAKWKQGKEKKDDFIFIRYCIPFLKQHQEFGSLDMLFDPLKISAADILEIAPKLEEICVNYIMEYMQHAEKNPGAATFDPTVYFLRFDSRPFNSRFAKNSDSKIQLLPENAEPVGKPK